MPATGQPPQAWSRRRLRRTLTVVVVAGCLLLAGLGHAGYAALTPTSTSASAAPTGQDPSDAADGIPAGAARRDAIAAAPMLAVGLGDGRGGTPAAEPLPSIGIPPAGRLGAAQVPTGYPPTPEGAVGQLAAIDTVVLQGMSIQTAHLVHDSWAAAEAPAAAQWSLTANVQAFLSSAAGQRVGEPSTSVTATPVAAQVKGTDGPDWVLACVLLDVTARAAGAARIAYGHCERMAWVGDRWLIGPGTAPARAPSTWPGTDLARRAGWRTWVAAGGGQA